jgi:hypothetical protein
MAADVVFTAEDPWYTNSQSWYGIVEFAMRGLQAAAREEYRRYVSAPLGIDFTALPDDKAAEVARWLCGAIENILAATAPDNDRSHAHLQELARKLHCEIQARDPGGSTHPPGQA